MFDFDFSNFELENGNCYSGTATLSEDYDECYVEKIYVHGDDLPKRMNIENEDYDELSEMLVDHFQDEFWEVIESSETKHYLRAGEAL